MRCVAEVLCESYFGGWIDVGRREDFGALDELIVAGEGRDSFAASHPNSVSA